MLRTHMIGLAIALSKAGEGEGPVQVPENTIHGLEYTLHHLSYSINRLRNSSSLHANGSDNAKALEILQAAQRNIQQEFAPGSKNPASNPATLTQWIDKEKKHETHTGFFKESLLKIVGTRRNSVLPRDRGYRSQRPDPLRDR